MWGTPERSSSNFNDQFGEREFNVTFWQLIRQEKIGTKRFVILTSSRETWWKSWVWHSKKSSGQNPETCPQVLTLCHQASPDSFFLTCRMGGLPLFRVVVKPKWETWPAQSLGAGKRPAPGDPQTPSGCCNKMPEAGWLKQEVFVFLSPGGWKVQDWGASRWGAWRGPCSWLAGGHVVALSSRGRERARLPLLLKAPGSSWLPIHDLI